MSSFGREAGGHIQTGRGSEVVMARKLPTQIVGNVGMYYAAYRLTLMGWNVMPTARNAKGIDLLAYDLEAERFLGIQVKTLSKRNAVPLGSSLDKIMGDWWIIVCREAEKPETFIMTAAEVVAHANRNEREGRVSYWLEHKSFWQPEFRGSWQRIGRGDDVTGGSYRPN